MTTRTAPSPPRAWPFKFSVRPGVGLVCNAPQPAVAPAPAALTPRVRPPDDEYGDDRPRGSGTSSTGRRGRRQMPEVSVELNWRAPERQEPDAA